MAYQSTECPSGRKGAQTNSQRVKKERYESGTASEVRVQEDKGQSKGGSRDSHDHHVASSSSLKLHSVRI